MVSAFKAKHPRNIPAAYHKPIGQLIVRWNITELYLQSVVWHIWRIKDPKAARLLTWDLNAVSKVELFRYLAPRWITDPLDRSELKAIADEADKLRAKRNRIAHGLWGYKPGNREKLLLVQVTREKRVQPKSEVISAADIKAWAAELDALNVKLIKFHRKLGAPLP